MTTLVEMQNATIYEQQKDLDTKDAEMARLKTELADWRDLARRVLFRSLIPAYLKKEMYELINKNERYL